MIALAGWASRSVFHQNFGLTLMALGAAIGATVFTRDKWLMKRRAKNSLQARADLEDLALDETMEGTLVVFDVTHHRLRGLLSEPGLKDVLDVDAISRNLVQSGEELYELARRHAGLRADEKRLREQKETTVVEQALASNEAQRTELEGAAERIASELSTLQTKFESTRTLARSVTRGEDEAARLQEAQRELDASTTAIRELAQLKSSAS